MADREPLQPAEIRARKPQNAPVGSVTGWFEPSEACLMRQNDA
jgi:hypothetical protein